MPARRTARVRAKLATVVGFVGTEMKFTARLWDLSPFGLSVKTSREIAIGTIFRLGIQVDVDVFRASAIVRSHIPGGFGVEFLAMTPVDRQTMQRLYLRLVMATRTA